MTDTALLILAKEPIPGRVKTRLCPPCDEHQAAAIARAAILDTVDAVLATHTTAPRLVLEGAPGPWLPRAIAVSSQADGGLGDRLEHAFAHAFARSSGSVVLIGMDTPQVTAAQLDAAITQLHAPETDAILGLTDDGGWWMIGFRSPQPGVFATVPMSVATTGRRQREQLAVRGLRTAMVETATDVDTFAHARAVAAVAPNTEFARAVYEVSAGLAPTGFEPRL